MSQNLPLEQAITQLTQDEQYLVRECAHQMQQVLDRYQKPHLQSIAVELVTALLQDSFPY